MTSAQSNMETTHLTFLCGASYGTISSIPSSYRPLVFLFPGKSYRPLREAQNSRVCQSQPSLEISADLSAGGEVPNEGLHLVQSRRLVDGARAAWCALLRILQRGAG
jgi:hypothetical protein